MKYKQTPSQTMGPFFAHGLTPEEYGYNFKSIARPTIGDLSVKGDQIIITGKVYDGNGDSVVDAMLEFWQCDPTGAYIEKEQDATTRGFKGFGRVGTGMNNQHIYQIHTVKPQGINNGAPFIYVTIFMRGMLNHQYTRIYFSDEADLNEKDEVFNLIPKSRQDTVLAKKQEVDGVTVYHFDIHIQGEKETVFFDI